MCTKLVPFLEEKLEGKRIALTPCEADTLPGTNQTKIYKTLTIRELDEGDAFPGMPEPERQPFNKTEYREQLEGHTSDDAKKRTSSYVSVVASCRTDIVSVKWVDFAALASTDMLLQVIQDSNAYVPLIDIQNKFMEQRKWEAFKKKTAQSISKRD